RRNVEPELVAHDSAAEVGAHVPPPVDRIADRHAARAEIVVDVVVLHVAGAARPEPGPVEVVPAGLDDGVDLNALRRAFGLAANGLYDGLFERAVVVARSAGVQSRFGRCRRHPLDPRPRVVAATEGAEFRVDVQVTEIDVRPDTGGLDHRRFDAG